MIYALDFGLKRIGLAKLAGNVVVPLNPIFRKNRNQAARELKEVLLKDSQMPLSSITLVFGLLGTNALSSKNEELQRRIKHFLALMDFDGKLDFINEEYSSKEALERLGGRVKGKDGRLDSISACIILERYLELKHA